MGTRGHSIGRREVDSGLAKLIQEGPYFTDGVRLFRLAGVVSGSSGPKLVRLEDCRTLEVSEFTHEEVVLLDLLPVSARPARPGAGAGPGHELVRAGAEDRR
jgi:hypothetical protein